MAQSKIVLVIIFMFLFFSTPSWGLFEKVATGIRDLHISKNIHLEIESPFPKGCFDSLGLVSRADCFPKNKLFLIITGKKHNFTKIVSRWNDVFVYFVQLTPGGYFADLDIDGNLEFAIYPMVAGNNTITNAYIYSIVGNKIKYYGIGRFNSERGNCVTDIVKGKSIRPAP